MDACRTVALDPCNAMRSMPSTDVASPTLPHTRPDLNASMSRSTFWASPWTRMCAWNFRRASSSSMAEKSISSTTQLEQRWMACESSQAHGGGTSSTGLKVLSRDGAWASKSQES